METETEMKLQDQRGWTVGNGDQGYGGLKLDVEAQWWLLVQQSLGHDHWMEVQDAS
jgi:hypothetical protein